MSALSPGYASVSDLAFREDKGQHRTEQGSPEGTKVAHLARLLDMSYISAQYGSTHYHAAYSSISIFPLIHPAPNNVPSLTCLLITFHANGSQAGCVFDVFLAFQTCTRCRASRPLHHKQHMLIHGGQQMRENMSSIVAHLSVSSLVYGSSCVQSLLQSTCTRASGQSFLPPSASESMLVPAHRFHKANHRLINSFLHPSTSST